MWIELTFFSEKNKVLVNADFLSEIVPIEDGGCRIHWKSDDSSGEIVPGVEVEEDYEQIKNQLIAK